MTVLSLLSYNLDSVTSKNQLFVCICHKETLFLSVVCYRSVGSCKTVQKSDALVSHFSLLTALCVTHATPTT